MSTSTGRGKLPPKVQFHNALDGLILSLNACRDEKQWMRAATMMRVLAERIEFHTRVIDAEIIRKARSNHAA